MPAHVSVKLGVWDNITSANVQDLYHQLLPNGQSKKTLLQLKCQKRWCQLDDDSKHISAISGGEQAER